MTDIETIEAWLVNGFHNSRVNLELISAIRNLVERSKRMERILVEIAKVNFAGPSTDERREWTWARAYQELKNSEEKPQ